MVDESIFPANAAGPNSTFVPCRKETLETGESSALSTSVPAEEEDVKCNINSENDEQERYDDVSGGAIRRPRFE